MIRLALWTGAALMVAAPGLSQSDAFEAQLKLGIERVQAQDFGGAIGPLEKAAALRPSSFQVNYVLGLALAQTGRKADAIRRLRSARQSNPKHAGVLVLLGVLYTGEGYSLDAVEVLEESNRIAPGQLNVNLLLIQACHDAFEFDKALTVAAETARRFPDSADAHFRLGYELEIAGRFDEARGSLERALELNPEHPEAHLSLGRLDARDPQRRVDAVNHFQAVLRLRPGNTEATIEMAKMFVATREFERAKQMLTRFEGGDDPTVHLLLSQIYLGEGDTARSARHRARYMELSTAQPGGMSGTVASRKLRRFDPVAAK